MNSETTPDILKRWQKLDLPGRPRLFGALIGFIVPYASSIRPEVLALEPGTARARLRDRRAVRNHLRSIHAAALMHLAELTGNMALMTRQPPGTRWIVTDVAVSYRAKARGAITASYTLEPVDWSEPGDVAGNVQLRDESGTVVATARMSWRTGPEARAAA